MISGWRGRSVSYCAEEASIEGAPWRSGGVLYSHSSFPAWFYGDLLHSQLVFPLFNILPVMCIISWCAGAPRRGDHVWHTGVNKKPFACLFQDRQFQNPDKLIDSFRNFYLWETVLDQTDAKKYVLKPFCVLDQRNIQQAILKSE